MNTSAKSKANAVAALNRRLDEKVINASGAMKNTPAIRSNAAPIANVGISVDKSSNSVEVAVIAARRID